ncbi:hypothetical protein EB796_022433 [Bugula neritina]|uniref:Uncharacterized protein n=1 Tax=Bugula neritina TaxID=10212 RepID=A0A7J7J0U1_BUGNE|nr:hypothetical protein EB796_022433 [Bugula neritina]
MILYNFIVRPFIYLLNNGFRLYYTHVRRFKLRYILKLLSIPAIFIFTLLIYNQFPSHSPEWYKHIKMSLKSYDINVAVVEEHHEVLQYWFTAAHKNLLPATGNVLIHIDGHGDSGIPAYEPEVSMFKTPENAEHIQMLMQRNDVFIMAAAYKDFISRFVWVYPDWMDVSGFTEGELNGAELKVQIGFYDLYYKDKLYTGTCGCYEVHQNATECDFIDEAGSLITNFTKGCKTYRTLPMHMVKSSQAPVILPSILAKTKDAPIILDIDEDYFGVMSGSDLLEGINFKLIGKFNELLADVFTIMNIKDEVNAHKLLLNILHLVKVTCTSTLSSMKECSREHFRHIQRFLRESGLQHTLIGKRSLRSDELLSIVSYISKNFNAQHIDQISGVGFCLITSTQTRKLNVTRDLQIRPYETISVCHGVNTPFSENQIYIPSEEDLDANIDVYESILKQVPNDRVKLITVVRSNRDGFTPRTLQPQIEEHILGSLNNKFGRTNVIYDPNLMLHIGQGIIL